MSKIKTCKICGSPWHYQTFCPLKRKNPIPKKGKQALLWVDVSTAWIEKHGSNHLCYICGVLLDETTLTLDHVIPKSNAKNYSNRHDDNNLKPCCWSCNSEKGSKHIDSAN